MKNRRIEEGRKNWATIFRIFDGFFPTHYNGQTVEKWDLCPAPVPLHLVYSTAREHATTGKENSFYVISYRIYGKSFLSRSGDTNTTCVRDSSSPTKKGKGKNQACTLYTYTIPSSNNNWIEE